MFRKKFEPGIYDVFLRFCGHFRTRFRRVMCMDGKCKTTEKSFCFNGARVETTSSGPYSAWTNNHRNSSSKCVKKSTRKRRRQRGIVGDRKLIYKWIYVKSEHSGTHDGSPPSPRVESRSIRFMYKYANNGRFGEGISVSAARIAGGRCGLYTFHHDSKTNERPPHFTKKLYVYTCNPNTIKRRSPARRV